MQMLCANNALSETPVEIILAELGLVEASRGVGQVLGSVAERRQKLHSNIPSGE